MVPQVASCNAAGSNDTSLHNHTLDNCFRTRVPDCLGGLVIDLMYVGEHSRGNLILFYVMVAVLTFALLLTILFYTLGS